jgi:mannose-1-phosphate guanylyltransferase
MFVWRASSFLAELERTAPAMHRAVVGCAARRPGAWERAPRLSVDYAVMERARGVRVVPLDAGWDDVGSWDAAARLREESGARDRDVVRVDSAGSAAFVDGKTVALVDVPGVVVVDTPDALLVVARNSSERVRKVVDELRRRRRKDLL